MTARVVYILGLPYSGSTLFSLALGNSEDLVNLGGVSYLENDYNDGTRCSCGRPLGRCPFWQKIKAALEEEQAGMPEDERFQLNERGTLCGPDVRSKPFLTRVRLALGGVYSAYPREDLVRYAWKHERFFRTVNAVLGGKMLIDVSKSPHRLQLLWDHTDLDLKVIWLRRNTKNQFKSKITRVKRRSKRYNPVWGSIWTLGWMWGYMRACERAYGAIPEDRKVIVSYEEFVAHPIRIQERLSQFLETPINFRIGSDHTLPFEGQHIFVGNRWLFRNRGLSQVKIRPSERTIGRMEEMVYTIGAWVIPLLDT